jgi:hypothetical protein
MEAPANKHPGTFRERERESYTSAIAATRQHHSAKEHTIPASETTNWYPKERQSLKLDTTGFKLSCDVVGPRHRTAIVAPEAEGGA